MNIDQAARRAAREIWRRIGFFETHIPEATEIIAAELAPLSDRLAEAERLLGRAAISFRPETDIRSDIDKFLAAKENGNG